MGLGLAACNTLPVTTDVNPNMSVSNCHTYAFAKEFVANANQPAAYGNPLNAERLRVAIESNLAARGIQRADHASADCVVGYAMGSYALGYYTPPLPPGVGPEVAPPQVALGDKAAGWGEDLLAAVNARARVLD